MGSILCYRRNRNIKKKDDFLNNYKSNLSSEEKLNILKYMQTEYVVFNVGGEIFKVSRYVIKNSHYDSYFSRIIKDDENFYFIDRSPEDFEIFLSILRNSNIKKSYSQEIKNCHLFKNLKYSIKNKDIFREDLKFYFKKDLEEILTDYSLLEFLELNNQNFNIKSLEIINPDKDLRLNYMYYKVTDNKQIYYEYNNKGIFLDHEGELNIILSSSEKIKRIELRPFILDEEYWKEGDCEILHLYYKNKEGDIEIYSSFDFILNERKSLVLYLDNLITDYLKLKTIKNQKLSISFLNIF
jgi:hypothetical protein